MNSFAIHLQRHFTLSYKCQPVRGITENSMGGGSNSIKVSKSRLDRSDDLAMSRFFTYALCWPSKNAFCYPSVNCRHVTRCYPLYCWCSSVQYLMLSVKDPWLLPICQSRYCFACCNPKCSQRGAIFPHQDVIKGLKSNGGPSISGLKKCAHMTAFPHPSALVMHCKNPSPLRGPGGRLNDTITVFRLRLPGRDVRLAISLSVRTPHTDELRAEVFKPASALHKSSPLRSHRKESA